MMTQCSSTSVSFKCEKMSWNFEEYIEITRLQVLFFFKEIAKESNWFEQIAIQKLVLVLYAKINFYLLL